MKEANKIQAIWIAKEWIEALTNIRDTNWLLFGSDYKNCWNTLNYNNSCICINNNTWCNTSKINDIKNNKKYKIYKNSTNNRWYLSPAITWTYQDTNYRIWNEVWLDSDWFFTQSWSVDKLIPLFTREIKIEYINTDSVVWNDSNDEQMKITSLVQWGDNSSNTPHKIELSTILSNYINKK